MVARSQSFFRGDGTIEGYRHFIRLIGPEAQGNRVSGAALRDLLRVLVDGTRGAVRLRTEGRSFSRGTPPTWLARAADFDVLRLEEGSTVVPLHARPLAETAPGRFAQDDLFGSISKRSGLSLFEESLDLALEGEEETEVFDQPLLKRFQGFSRLLDHDIEAVEISSEESEDFLKGGAMIVQAEKLQTIDRLIKKTPPPQRTRLVGKLDMIRHSDRLFCLKLESGQTVKGVAESVTLAELKNRWGGNVVVHGTVSFRPSGTVLRIEAEAIEEADETSSMWSQIPKPVFHRLDIPTLRQEQGPRSGLKAICGQWPGDETDEEIAEALAELS